MTSWAERAKLHFLQECPKRTDKTDKTTIVFLQERQKPTDKTDKTPLSSVLSVPFWHSCEKRDFQNQGFDVANDQTVCESGTRRPPDLSPKLLAASLALDARLEAAGYSLALPDDRPVPQATTTVAVQKDNPPPRKKILDHFHIDSAWRALSREYYQHHFKCPQCQCASRGIGQRCDAGVELWQRAHG